MAHWQIQAKQLIEDLFKKDEDVLQEGGITVFVDSLGDSAVVIGARCWVEKDAYWNTKWRLTEGIKLTLDEKVWKQIDFQALQVMPIYDEPEKEDSKTDKESNGTTQTDKQEADTKTETKK